MPRIIADGLCQVVIDTTSKVEVTSWANVWLHIGLINAGCVRQGKGGRAGIPGKDPSGFFTQDLVVTVMDEPAQLALPGNENNTQQDTSTAATA